MLITGETDGLKIKDAELFEVSVVSVPCNQAATFSLSKSFDSMEEYEDFKKTFKNSVDLAGQSLAKDENSSVASDTPDGVTKAQKEMKMSEVQTPEIDLDAFAKKVAEETAAKIAMKQAEEKAAAEAARKEVEEAEMAKAAQEEEVQSAIKVGVESGAERLMADLQKEFEAKEADTTKFLTSTRLILKRSLLNSKPCVTASVTSLVVRLPVIWLIAKDLLSAHFSAKLLVRVGTLTTVVTCLRRQKLLTRLLLQPVSTLSYQPSLKKKYVKHRRLLLSSERSM